MSFFFNPPIPSYWVSSDNNDPVTIKIDYPVRTERLLVNSLPSTNFYLPTTLTYYNDPIIYANPYYSNVSYLNINSDKDLQKKTTKYFFSQLYNVYIPESNSDILDYVKLNPRDIELVKSTKQANQNSTKRSDFAEKITYLSENIFTKNDVYNALLTYIDKNDINWWDLKNVSNDVERLLIKKIEEKIKSMINE